MKNITSNSAVVHWDEILSNEASYGVIEGTLVIVTTASMSFNVSVTGSISEVMLRNLLSNTTYFVQVFAYNQYGDGNRSIVYRFSTTGMYLKRNCQLVKAGGDLC